MALYKRGKYWWVSMWHGKKHILKSTKLEDKRLARKVESALYLTGWAIDGAGKRLEDPWHKDEGSNRKHVEGLLRAVYGECEDRTSLTALWKEYEDTIKVRGKHFGERTLSEKKGDFENFVSWAMKSGVETLDGVTVAVAKKYSLSFVGKVSDKRRLNILSAISSVWNAISPAHSGITNPWPSVTPTVDPSKTDRTGFTNEDEKKVLKAAKEIHPQWYVACIIGRNTGLRYGDVCRLTSGDIDFVTNTISTTPRKTEHSSGVKVSLPMSNELRDTLLDWFERNPRMTKFDRVLPWIKERAPKGDRRFRAVLDRAGVDHNRFSFHSFRHSVETRLCEAGASLDVRKRILGHTTDVMADRYNHADLTKEMKSALDKASASC